uniref:PDZ domain-containing protein n=1 Tax=Steinernema glaseri TaxID=37863 RepID=A0A1I8AHW1_9BILA
APGDEQFAVTHEAQVAGAQPGAPAVLDEGLCAGLGVAPVTVGDARAGGPDLAHLVVAQHGQGVRFDDLHRVQRLAEAAAHLHAALACFGAVQAADQAHVVVQRQPADDHVVGVHVDAEAVADQHFVGHQVAVADLHALGQRGGAGGVLQKGDVVRLERRGLPLLAQAGVEVIDAEQLRRILALECIQGQQAVVQVVDGQQQARLGVLDDRQQAGLVVGARGFRRIGRHGDHPGIQAAEERGDVVRATGEQQDRAVARHRTRLQCGGDAACTQVQVTVAEHGLVAGVFGEKAQGHPLRGQRSTL